MFPWNRHSKVGQLDMKTLIQPHCSLNGLNSDTSYSSSDYYSESSEEETCSEIIEDDQKLVFICVHGNNIQKNFICFNKEIKNYRKKYSELPKKNIKNIATIWDDVRVFIPSNKNDFNMNKMMPIKNLKSTMSQMGQFNFTSDSEQSDIIINSSRKSIQKKKIVTGQDKTIIANKKIKNSNINNIISDAKFNSNKENKKTDEINDENRKTDEINDKNRKTDEINDKNRKIDSPEFKKPSISTNKSTNVNDKNLKKKQKKKKQKVEKLQNNRESSNSSSRDVSESREIKPSQKQNIVNSNLKQKKTKQIQKDEMKLEFGNTSDDNIDLLLDSNTMPAFIDQSIKNKMKNSVVKSKQTPPVQKSVMKNITLDDIEQDFILQSRKRKKPVQIVDKGKISSSEKMAEKALNMILNQNLVEAIKLLTNALGDNPNEDKHYLNRCYCYLRTKEYDLALSDAIKVIKTSSNNAYLFIANLRAGQASFLLEEYHQAKVYVQEATMINPTNYLAQRELLRIQKACIINMGFKERDAVLALERYSTVEAAVNYLTNNVTKNLNLENDSVISYNKNDDIVFSSDEDEKPSNYEILNRIYNVAGLIKIHQTICEPLELLQSTKNTKALADTKNVLKFNSGNGKLKDLNKTVTDSNKTLYVGNLNKTITDAMLKKKFKQFGNIKSIRRPQDYYAFIDFESSKDVIKILNANSYEIAGVTLRIRCLLR